MYRLFSVPLYLGVTLLLGVALLSSAVLAQENNEAKKLYNDGNAKLKSGDFAGAVQMYDKAIALEKHQYYYYQRGLALRKAGKESEAIESFQAAVEVAPKFAEGYNALGGGYFALKNYGKSVAAYQTALKEKPNLGPAKKGLAAALTARANAQLEDGEAEGAIASCTEAVEADPNYSTAYIIMAKAHNKIGKYKEAITAGENALKKMKTNKGAAWFEIGLAHRNLGNSPKARQAFTEAKKDATYARSAEYELKQLP